MIRVPVIGTFIKLALGALALLPLPMTDLAAAQDQPGPVAEFAGGWVGFADDGVVSQSLIGGAVRCPALMFIPPPLAPFTPHVAEAVVARPVRRCPMRQLQRQPKGLQSM